MSACGHDDVEELLGTKIRGEAGLVDHVVGEMQADALGEDAARAVRDIGKRAAVTIAGAPSSGLHQIRQQRIVEQHHHRTDSFQVGGGSARRRR